MRRKRRRGVRRNGEQWSEILRRCEASGLTSRAFSSEQISRWKSKVDTCLQNKACADTYNRANNDQEHIVYIDLDNDNSSNIDFDHLDDEMSHNRTAMTHVDQADIEGFQKGGDPYYEITTEELVAHIVGEAFGASFGQNYAHGAHSEGIAAQNEVRASEGRKMIGSSDPKKTALQVDRANAIGHILHVLYFNDVTADFLVSAP